MTSNHSYASSQVRFLLVLVFLLAPCRGRQETGACAQSVDTATGQVRGKTAESGACAWLGLPYAAPPVGERRWRRPEPPEPWTGVREAVDYGDKCVQLGVLSRGSRGRVRGSEDCLYLNVWRPQKSGTFPVMVWIHGGGLMSGSGASPLYAGDQLAEEQDVVVVTFNYRLGVFGFLAHEDFRTEDPEGSVGNYGLWDQIAALEWVRNNIAAFSGDPKNVTIFGESAGGWSVCTLLATPRARGLFHRAIQESGNCVSTRTLPDGRDTARELARELGCPDGSGAQCLRSRSVKQIMKTAYWNPTGKGSPFKPHQDGVLLDRMPIDYLRAGDYARVPYLAGSNRDEYRLFVVLEPRILKMTPQEYADRVRQEHGEKTDQVLALYPADSFSITADAYLTQEADRSPGCGSHDPVQALAGFQSDVYYYRFDYDEIRLAQKLGAFHGLEIMFVFGTLDRFPGSLLISRGSRGPAAQLSRTVMAYWTNFARTGNPNGDGLPVWPAYEPQQRRRLVLDTGPLQIMPEPELKDRRCEFWDQDLRQPRP